MNDGTDDMPYSPVIEALRIIEAAARPTIRPCPTWCIGHRANEDDLDFEPGAGDYVRHHEALSNDEVAVSVPERYHPDGSVTYGAPEVYSEAFMQGRTTSVDEVRALGTAMLQAAETLERLDSPRSVFVEALWHDSTLSTDAKKLLLASYDEKLRISEEVRREQPDR